MAGDWIPIRCDIASEPEVIRIAEQTGLDEDAVVGKLHRLWSWANRHTADGNAPGVTEKWIDRYLHCDGFAEAMTIVGWLNSDDYAVWFPKFDRFNSQSAKSRALTAKRVAEHKRKSNAGSNASGNGASVSDALPKEEKRREDIVSSTKKQKRSRFKPPTVEEVRAFCAEKSYSVDAEAFVAHYEANGWKVGRNAMKSWQSACVTWHKRSGEFTNARGSPHDDREAARAHALKLLESDG